MPLRDHFHPPLDNLRHWEGFHATWPVMIVASLAGNCRAAISLSHESIREQVSRSTWRLSRTKTRVLWRLVKGTATAALATAVWAPPQPTLAVVTDLPAQDVYEVRVYDEKRHCRLVAAVEIVSPANKDRPEHRNAFVSKCVGLLREQVSVVIVDLVTTRTQNVYAELLERIGQSDPSWVPTAAALYCRLPRDQAR